MPPDDDPAPDEALRLYRGRCACGAIWRGLVPADRILVGHERALGCPCGLTVILYPGPDSL